MVDEVGQVIQTTMVETLICGRWPLLLPEKRAERPEWPWWEWPRMASMRANLYRGMVLWDVGTESGDQSAVWAQWVSGQGIVPTHDLDHRIGDGGIVLIEPNPMCWGNVRAIWEANEIPDPLGWYVGFVGAEEKPGPPSAEAIAGFDGWPLGAHGPMIADHGTRHLAYEQDRTATTTLDVLAAESGYRVDAITMDIEGAEVAALEGATRVLAEQRPLLWVSIHPDQLRDLYDKTRDDVLDLLIAAGYEYEHLAAEHELHTFAWPTERRDDVTLPYRGRGQGGGW